MTAEFPAGGIERKDAGHISDPESGAEENAGGPGPDFARALAAARRELREETGYESDDWQPLLKVPSDATLSDNYAYLFMARNCRCVSGQSLDETEYLRIRKYSAEEIEEMIMTGRFQQAVHVAAWFLAKEKTLREEAAGHKKPPRGLAGRILKTGCMVMALCCLLLLGGCGKAAAPDTAGAGAMESSTSAGESSGRDTGSGRTSAADGEAAAEKTDTSGTPETENAGGSLRGTIPAVDFALRDQYGELHHLSDYKGKIVFLNFWATWCPPCRAEMPDIQKLYEETLLDPDSDLRILGVAAPGVGREGSVQDIRDFLEENGYTYPTVMMEDESLYYTYGIEAFPTTYMIDRNGNIYGYIAGSLTEEVMRDIIEQTRQGS